MNKFVNIIDEGYAKALLPKRKADSHKGDYGRILIITGSTGMTGAGCLAALSALRSGAGLVYIGVPKSLVNIYDMNVMEAITLPLEDNNGVLSKECSLTIKEHMKKSNIIAIGPGLSTNGDVFHVVHEIIKTSKVPLILDADALNAISKDPDIIKGHSSEIVITPHPGEMSSLIGISIEDINNNRISVACEFSKRMGVTTVLKGNKTVIANKDGKVFINHTGNPGMATAGTGDVLTGIIASFIGQGLNSFDAAILSVYIHGKAGDIAAIKKGEHGLISRDLIEELPIAIMKLT